MLISLCIPIMNRLDDLIRTMPDRIANARSSPPVEIVVLDYNSSDDLSYYMDSLMSSVSFPEGSGISYHRYTGSIYFRSAHAYNLALLSGQGEWVVLTPADVFVKDGYVKVLRERIAEGCLWCNTERKRRSTIAFNKQEFINAGGYDERFDTYGPDDVDIIERFERRMTRKGIIPDSLLDDIYTPPLKKIENYPTGFDHKELGRQLMPYLYENRASGQLVANQGIEWGAWK